MAIYDSKYIVTMPDGSRWAVPVEVIAISRAAHYVDEFGGNMARSLEEDTLPLFEKHPSECADWAKNNMNWDDVKERAIRVHEPQPEPDWQEGWVNGEWEIR